MLDRKKNNQKSSLSSSNQALKTWSHLQKQLFLFNLASCLGPILIFVGAGFFLDRINHTTPLFILIGFVLAIISTILLLKKILRDLSSQILPPNSASCQKKEND